MHEVKGFPSASVQYSIRKDIDGSSSFLRDHRLPNSISSGLGYDSPLTEVDGDIYVIQSPELDINGIVWQSGTTVRFTFTSGYDSSLYSVDSYLQVSGDSSIHNGVWLITVVNVAYIEVTNINATDGSKDVISGSPALGYVTHEEFDPENLSNGQSIPMNGQVRYYAVKDLWYGDEFIEGDCYYNESTKELDCWNGVSITSKTKRITNSDSPYTVLKTDEKLFCNTDSGAIAINIYAGLDGKRLKVINTGSSTNDVTVDPDGSENIYGSSASFTLIDSEIIEIDYNPTDGWW